jgi:hypothetical protein
MALASVAKRIRLTVPRWAPVLPPYLIGVVAMFWAIQRISVF